LKAGRNIAEQRKLVKLKEELQKAILLEEYEKAARLRDEIRDIQKSEGDM
jgi:protein arginine kinase activator